LLICLGVGDDHDCYLQVGNLSLHSRKATPRPMVIRQFVG
jgi:hypothetical protein